MGSGAGSGAEQQGAPSSTMEGRSVTSSPRTLLLVGVGNVGAGIAEAFVRRGWQVRGVDPNPALAPTEVRDSVIPCAIDDLPDAELAELLAASDEIVYAAECGNRDEYAVRPDLGQQNNMRFERFACRVVRCSPAGAHIAYVGGSWTRRALSKGGSAVVTDASPAKAAAEANPYEAAKTAAAAAAAALAAQLPGLRLTFYDWASVVPNLAPNFSIAKMAAAALAGEPVRYSAGDFGRPLLGAADAGCALLLATEARLEVAAGASAVAGQGGCEVRDAPPTPSRPPPCPAAAAVASSYPPHAQPVPPQPAPPRRLPFLCLG